ncbi:MAG: DNA polymerase III subunit beta [Spirochaetaceae bacterium]
MKFTCERDVIIREISIAQEIISSRNVLSILSNVLLSVEDNTLTIRATDLKVSFETQIPVEVQESGSTTVFCDKLLGILRSLPSGDIEFETSQSDTFVIRPLFRKIDFQLRSISSDKFPEIQHASEDQFFEFSQSQLIEMISQTVFAVSDDETRYFMNGVYFENVDGDMVMVATDGRRLSYIRSDSDGELPEFPGIIVPPKILSMVRKLASGEGNIRIAVSEKTVFFHFDNQKLSSSLIEGQFPNYQRVIPEEQKYSLTISRSELSEALRRVSLLVEKSRRIYLKLSEGSMVISSEQSEVGVAREELECSFEGPETLMALNFVYLTEPLKVIESEQIELHFTEPTKAMTLYSVPKTSYFHIVMPMQLD